MFDERRIADGLEQRGSGGQRTAAGVRGLRELDCQRDTVATGE